MNNQEIPKVFWKYYDLFRRKIITIEEFSALTKLTKEQIAAFLQIL